jgi:hypothetical protein
MACANHEDALMTLKQQGKYHRTVERDSGNTISMFDSAGNYLELHFSRPGGRRNRRR